MTSTLSGSSWKASLFTSSPHIGYHTKDVQWFLELANKQEHWKTNPLECDQSVQVEHTSSSQIPQLPQEAISMSVFKLYLGHILGSCEQCVDKVAALSGPLQLYHHQPRSQVGCTLMATPHLGLPAPYIPTFYLRCPSITLRANHKVSVYVHVCKLGWVKLLTVT